MGGAEVSFKLPRSYPCVQLLFQAVPGSDPKHHPVQLKKEPRIHRRPVTLDTAVLPDRLIVARQCDEMPTHERYRIAHRINFR